MRNTYQKKFYTSKETDKIVNEHAERMGYGYSKALRSIVNLYAGELIQSKTYDEYVKNWPASEVNIRG